MTDQPAPPVIRDVHAVLAWAARLEREGQSMVSIAGLRLQLNRAVSAPPADEPREIDASGHDPNRDDWDCPGCLAARSESPDDAPATTETSVEYRVIGTPPTTWGGLDLTENAEISSSDPLTFEEADHRSLILKIRNGWTGVRVESRQVSTTTTTTAWKAEQT